MSESKEGVKKHKRSHAFLTTSSQIKVRACRWSLVCIKVAVHVYMNVSLKNKCGSKERNLKKKGLGQIEKVVGKEWSSKIKCLNSFNIIMGFPSITDLKILGSIHICISFSHCKGGKMHKINLQSFITSNSANAIESHHIFSSQKSQSKNHIVKSYSKGT